MLPETVLRRLPVALASRAAAARTQSDGPLARELGSVLRLARASGATDEQLALAASVVLMLHSPAESAPVIRP